MAKRILVIDDDEAVRKSFLLALEDTAYTVETADSGEQGIEKAGADRYHLVFLDLKMPGLNGVETMRGLREIDQEVPIYIVTGFHQEFFSQLKEADEEGINFQVLQKPISNTQITLLAESVLGEGPLLSEE
jgi:CheY-like chemotaxis protein